jgi:hypothetical protein
MAKKNKVVKKVAQDHLQEPDLLKVSNSEPVVNQLV